MVVTWRKRASSASSARLLKVKPPVKKEDLAALLRKASSRSRSEPERKPHQAWEAYVSFERVVEVNMRERRFEERPLALRDRRAKRLEDAELIVEEM